MGEFEQSLRVVGDRAVPDGMVVVVPYGLAPLHWDRETVALRVGVPRATVIITGVESDG